MPIGMFDYIQAIKRLLRDQYHFKPSRIIDGDLCFENVPDGEYPMVIDDKLDNVRISNGQIFCCRFGQDSTAR